MTENLFEIIADANGKPIPRWQERLEQKYTEGVPFGEILGLVRALIDDSAIEHILSMSDEDVIASFPGDIEQHAEKMRRDFNVIARLVRERDELKAQLEQARKKHGHGCECQRCKTDAWWDS